MGVNPKFLLKWPLSQNHPLKNQNTQSVMPSSHLVAGCSRRAQRDATTTKEQTQDQEPETVLSTSTTMKEEPDSKSPKSTSELRKRFLTQPEAYGTDQTQNGQPELMNSRKLTTHQKHVPANQPAWLGDQPSRLCLLAGWETAWPARCSCCLAVGLVWPGGSLRRWLGRLGGGLAGPESSMAG